jgi:hypothetical protein
LRRRHPAEAYIGIELEVNQRHAAAGGPRWTQLRADIIGALLQVLDQHKVAGSAVSGMAEPSPATVPPPRSIIPR